MILNIKKVKIKKIDKFLITYNKYKSFYMCPNFKSVVLNTNLGIELGKNDKFKNESEYIFQNITSQKPKTIRAKQSVSNFKLRKGDEIVLFCSITKYNLFLFLTKMIFLVLPQVESKNISLSNLDQDNNINFGLQEHLVFPEIGFSYDKKPFGLNVNINMKNISDKKSNLQLLRFLSIFNL